MSTLTPNIGLEKVTSSQTIGELQESMNGSGGNMDILDGKIGPVGATSLQAQVDALNSNLGGLHMVQLTKTVTSGYFAISSSEIPSGKKLIIQNCYITNSNYSDLTFAVQANASGSANAYYVYVRKGSSNPPENTSVTVNILYMD